jgi:peptidylprolyl isomerase
MSRAWQDGLFVLTDAKDQLVRRTSALFLTVALAASLAACSTAADEPTDEALGGCESARAGSASDSVEVAGDFDSTPEITFTGPLEPETTERTIVIQGDGAPIGEGDTVLVSYTILNGDTAAEIESTHGSGQTVQVLIDSSSPMLSGLSKTLACTNEGTRVVGVIPSGEAFGESGQSELGLEANQSLVFVADVVSLAPEPVAPLPRAEGQPQDAPEGFPSVVLGDDGAPTITIPDGAPPTELSIAVLIQGDGAVVAPDATVTVHYTGINWNTGAIFDSSWPRGEPAQFPTGGVIAGFREALVGQQVGSQVIVIIPPELGYGPQGGTPDGSIGPDDTIVFVVDILATT